MLTSIGAQVTGRYRANGKPVWIANACTQAQIVKLGIQQRAAFKYLKKSKPTIQHSNFLPL